MNRELQASGDSFFSCIKHVMGEMTKAARIENIEQEIAMKVVW